jgi:hypothetical protein
MPLRRANMRRKTSLVCRVFMTVCWSATTQTLPCVGSVIVSKTSIYRCPSAATPWPERFST